MSNDLTLNPPIEKTAMEQHRELRGLLHCGTSGVFAVGSLRSRSTSHGSVIAFKLDGRGRVIGHHTFRIAKIKERLVKDGPEWKLQLSHRSWNILQGPPAMTSTISSLFGYKPDDYGAPKAPAEPVKALPASWYRSPEIYELERRAIFSKKWILITHKLRFEKPGDFYRFEMTGFSFVLCLNRQGNLSGFHNICRHRAFPLVSQDQGNSPVVSCKYHGWSYGLDGKLTKAPKFDDVPGFKKEEQSLFPVHIHVDALGFVWVNLDSSRTPIPWEDDFQGVDTQERFREFDFGRYMFDHTWHMNGNYNWKTLADNYNECYHCSVAHPDVAKLADLSYYYTVSKAGHIQHFSRPKQDKVKDDIKNASTYYFPNACMTVSPHFFYLMRCVPTSVGTCSMEYEVYRNKEASDEDFEYIDSFFKRVLNEDKHLCNAAQKNLDAGVFVNGQLHPDLESAPLFFQNTVRGLLRNHRDEEKRQNMELWPARQSSPGSATAEDINFCAELTCSGKYGDLEW